MLWRDYRAWQIFGANTNVGKTIWSTILCKALARRTAKDELLYLKPISTGPDNETDDSHIKRYAGNVFAQCLKQYAIPASPHLAALHADANHQLNIRPGKLSYQDEDILRQIRETVDRHRQQGGSYALLETAGGPLSPTPSGSVQADLYRPLRLPTLLIGDSQLGGISTTISAFESLHLRGYDIESLLLFNIPQWGNADYLREYFKDHNVNVLSIPPPPEREADEQQDQRQLAEYYDFISESTPITTLVDLLKRKHYQRIAELTALPEQAESIIWHPFRQYGLPQNVIAIDSAYGDHFQAYDQEVDDAVSKTRSRKPGINSIDVSPAEHSLLTPLFDASASWWTQGLGHGNPNLALTAANAAGRYGHVMFANAVHEPALDLAYNLLETLRNPRLSKVFYTDNGSTGMEVAVKMALRSSCQRYGWNKHDDQIGIIGLKGSYHGDTIGVMNASEPSPFNEKVDWYEPWGHWFTPPEVKLVKGEWHVLLPEDMPSEVGSVTIFSSLNKIFEFDSRQEDTEFYQRYISQTLEHLTKHQKRKFGALILEPLIMGAGGMIFVDPLFQRVLIQTVRADPRLICPDTEVVAANKGPTTWSGIPVIADEVFTGLYRLGRASSSSFWYESASTPDAELAPDISCHAKLLTGGLLPLAITTASDSIFQTFVSDSKADALLHGHSYTAHAIGCAVANKSLAEMREFSSSTSQKSTTGVMSDANTWQVHKENWQSNDLFSFFQPQFLNDLSKHESVSSCWSLGTVLALTLKSASLGYNSQAAASLQKILLKTLDSDGRGVHSRVLGNVIYFMTSLVTRPGEVKKLEQQIMAALNKEVQG